MPASQTSGDQREDHAQAVADTVAAIYAAAELALIVAVAGLARHVAAGIMTATVAQQRLAHTSRQVLTALVPRVQAALTQGMSGALQGVRQRAAATAGPGAALRVTMPDPAPLAELLDKAAATAKTAAREALTAATAKQTTESTGAPVNVFTPYQQAVDRAIASTRGGMPGTSLSLSRIQAAQKALDDLGQQGITGFVDRTGRNWNLVSYVEMATRTAVSAAWDDMQAAAMVRSGLDLVVVSTHSTEGSCPRCLPWLGRTLSLTGATTGYPTLDDAKASGFRHPNCRCFWAPVGAGLAEDVTNPVALEHAAAGYRASQRQRALEREVRKAGRRAHAAITPAARTQARRDLADARQASAAHRRLTGLRMTKAAVQRREHPFRAR